MCCSSTFHNSYVVVIRLLLLLLGHRSGIPRALGNVRALFLLSLLVSEHRHYLFQIEHVRAVGAGERVLRLSPLGSSQALTLYMHCQQQRCPHGVTTGSDATSKQILQLKLLYFSPSLGQFIKLIIMGCTSVTNNNIKNPQIAAFFSQCSFFGFQESRLVKITKYGYHYDRGTKEWRAASEKTFFSSDNPLLFSPCQPDQFDALLDYLRNAKIPQLSNLNSAPIGMLLCKGDPFLRFTATFLGDQQQTIFSVDKLTPTLFVYWKLEEAKSVPRFSLTLRSTANRFVDVSQEKTYQETAFQRALLKLGTQFQIIGLCFDAPEKRPLYESLVHPNERHIWISEQDQSFQVFRYAEDDDSNIRGLEDSVFIIVNGAYAGCVRENFGDRDFVQDLLNRMSTASTAERRKQNFMSQIKLQTRRDDYQRVKSIIKEKLPEIPKQPVGDTFSFTLQKITYFYSYEKVGATYCPPTLIAAGSTKYSQNYESLMKWIKDQTPIAHMVTDFKKRESLEKPQFFKTICSKFKEVGYDDVRFILEKSLVIFLSPQGFRLQRSIDKIHNAPLGVGAVFSRKNQLVQVQKQFLSSLEKFTHTESRLLKDYFMNPYLLNTQFLLGSLYNPIPNVYSITHNDQSGNIASSTIRQPARGIFDSKLVKSVDNSYIDGQFPIIEQIPSNVSKIELSQDWEQDYQELNYEQVDVIQQLNSEVLVIYLLDYTSQQLEVLGQLLEFIRQQGWGRDKIRVVGLCSKANDGMFETQLHKFQIEKYMSIGTFESWFPLEQHYLGVSFNKLLSDLYGLDQKSPILVIDQMKRLLFRGVPDRSFASLIRKIVNNSTESKNFVHAPDRQLRHRINCAQFEKEWRTMKKFSFSDACFENLIEYVKRCPLKKNEFWKFKMTSFQLWDHHGELIRKFFEKPTVFYSFERPELSVKFYTISDMIKRRLGEKKVDLIDLKDPTQKKVGYLDNADHLLS